MTGTANEPAPVEKKPLPRWVWAVVGVIVILLLASISIPVYGQPAEKSIQTMNLAVAKGIYPAIKMYGGDHEGRYPVSLAELEPDYLSTGGLDRTRYRDPESLRRYDWLYIQGLTENSPADWIVLASPTEQIGKGRGFRRRIVVYNDGSATAVTAEKFNEALAAQFRAMPEKSPEEHE